MKLRSHTDTTELTVEELIRSVYPDNLDASFSWPAQVGERVWVKVNGRWRPGVVTEDRGARWTTKGLGRQFRVEWGARKKFSDCYFPTNGNLKPDYVAVRNALLDAGYDVINAS